MSIPTDKHIVILGSGSTVATLKELNTEVNSYTLENFCEDPFFTQFLESLDIDYKKMNIEEICDYLNKSDKEKYEELCKLIRQKYEQIKLPKDTCILEKLLLSLTNKDVVISFNWDSLIIQAYNRVQDFIPQQELPDLLFPHGNVEAGYTDTKYGCLSNPQNAGFTPSPLNMPVDELDYLSNRFIQDQWNKFKRHIYEAQMITFFGYSGPPSDAKDMETFFNIFVQNRDCARFEVIDKDTDTAKQVSQKWSQYILYTEHEPECRGSFYESRMAIEPRQSIRSLDCWNGLTKKEYSFEPSDSMANIVYKLNLIDELKAKRTNR